MTFGTHVHVHELGFSECAKSYVFQVRDPCTMFLLFSSQRWHCFLLLGYSV